MVVVPGRMSRRRFLAVSGQTALLTAGAASAGAAAAAALPRVDALPTGVTRTWLGPQYWANRLADWRLHDGRIECLRGDSGGRTVAVLSRSLRTGAGGGVLEVRTGTLAAGSGTSGFLVGAGAGALDWRAAALVMAAAGTGGGFLAVYDSDGQVRFRDHSSEAAQFAYAVLPSEARSGAAPARTVAEDVTLRLELLPVATGTWDLRLTARTTATGALLSTATRRAVPDRQLAGGISLVSTVHQGSTTARHWFRDLRTGGQKVAVHARGLGPVRGVLYSLAGRVLKLNALLMPVGPDEPQDVVLEVRRRGTTEPWRRRATVRVGAGWCALFRVADWDGTQDWDYRVGWSLGTPQEAWYAGVVRRDPVDQERVAIGMVNCTIHAFRSTDIPSRSNQRLPGSRSLGLYTRDNLYFPYGTVVAGLQRAHVDLLVAFGDQYYESKPTQLDLVEPALDVLYKHTLWMWTFGELTRSTPTLCLVDDHDVYHPNLWGWAGRAAPSGDVEQGGYRMPPAWVDLVQRIQCGHDPDPYDPTPVLQGIDVYYSSFAWGGLSLAVLEDRKFKDTNATGLGPDGAPLTAPRQLLGARQERFLTAWTAQHPGLPKICLTQTLFACLQTTVDGVPGADADSNGTPVDARRRAVRLLKQARALVLSGDQHLGSLVRHGIDTHTDGPVQFTPPAAGTAWQRWWRPATPLPGATAPDTGDATDAYGNRLRVLAVVNPRISFAQVRTVQPHNNVGDRALKREGYGVVEVDRRGQRHVLHCWPWDAAAGGAEYPGFPYALPFSEV